MCKYIIFVVKWGHLFYIGTNITPPRFWACLGSWPICLSPSVVVISLCMSSKVKLSNMMLNCSVNIIKMSKCGDLMLIRLIVQYKLSHMGVWCEIVQYDVKLSNMMLICPIWCEIVQYDVKLSNMMWNYPIWCKIVQYDVKLPNMMWNCPIWC